MAFTSLSFVLLLLVTLTVYYLLPRRFQWLALLCASLAFYAAGGLSSMGYLAFTVCTTYAAGRYLGVLNARWRACTAEERKAAPGAAVKRRKKWTAGAAVTVNFLLLFFVKYWNHTASAVSGLTGLALPRLDLLLPLGLSFYMFQSVGYVIDCYRGKYPPERNPAKFALFVSFFPQMVQGPISRFDQLSPQLIQGRSFDADQMKYGIQLALAGYLKKLVLADRAAVVVNTVFSDHLSYGGAMTAAAVLFYCVQLYCDFSGGIDITRGVAQMFGIHLVENFQRPIFAISLPDYWRRWHITLGGWMRDYLFYPLSLSKPFARLGRFTRRRIGGKLGKIVPTSLATFIIYFVIGIWHGASFRYIAFGLYNGVLITAGLLMAGPFTRLKERLGVREDGLPMRIFRMLRTMLLVFIGRYITRAPRLLTAAVMLWRTVSMPCLYQVSDGTILRLGLTAFDLAVVGVGCAVLLAAELLQERGVVLCQALEKRSPLVQWLFIFIPLLILTFLGIFRDGYIQSEFIYRQF